jgi:hypothetical protein
MKKVKTVLGIFWASLCLLLIIILFPGLNTLSAKMGSLPFMKINPNMTGGLPAKEIVMENCTLVVRKPVFDGLIGERKSGFVQVDWRGKLPMVLNDTIDYNLDGNPDFIVKITPPQTSAGLLALNPKVKKIGISTPTSYGWAIRVNIDK